MRTGSLHERIVGNVDLDASHGPIGRTGVPKLFPPRSALRRVGYICRPFYCGVRGGRHPPREHETRP